MKMEKLSYNEWMVYIYNYLKNKTEMNLQHLIPIATAKDTKPSLRFGKPGQRTIVQIEAEIEHLRAKDTETNNRVRSTYNLSK